MGRELDVLVVCEINVDIVVSGMDGPPRFGAERVVGDVTLTAGSSGVLTATGLASLGLKVGVCGMVGDDPFGRYMLEHCARHGIDTAAVVVDPAPPRGSPTGASVLLSTTDDRAILTHPGVMAQFGLDQIRQEALARAGHLHLSSFFLQAALRPDVGRLLDLGRGLGLSTSCDTGHDPEERWEIGDLLNGLDIFLPNEVEALAISGATSVERALAGLASRVGTVAVTCGAVGAWAARGDERRFVPGFAVRTVDTTGAGDAFDAGFLAAILRGADLETAVRQGNACGALTAARVGGGVIDAARVNYLLGDRGVQSGE